MAEYPRSIYGYTTIKNGRYGEVNRNNIFTGVWLVVFILGSVAASTGAPLLQSKDLNISDSECLECHTDIVESPAVHEEASCIDCHGNESLTPHTNLELPPPKCLNCHFESVRRFEESVHGGEVYEGRRIECSRCHGSHDIDTIASPESPMGRRHQSEVCGECHQGERDDYNRSIHGLDVALGGEYAPVCVDCHGKQHEILSHDNPESDVYASRIAKATCGKCHESVILSEKYGLPAGRVRTYIDSYHGIRQTYGDIGAANCASCHGTHKILPSSHEESMIHISNLVSTCGKCHPGANENFTKGRVHVDALPDVSPGVYYVRQFYTWFIGILVLLFLFHIVLDYTKFMRDRQE